MLFTTYAKCTEWLKQTYTVWNPHNLSCWVRMVERVSWYKVGCIFIQRHNLHL